MSGSNELLPPRTPLGRALVGRIPPCDREYGRWGGLADGPCYRRPWWQAVVYALLLGTVVRFFHFALFEGTLLSLRYYLVDAAVCVIAALLGYRTTRSRQMATQYRWLSAAEPRDGSPAPPVTGPQHPNSA
jgi:hypothetical protein